MIKKLATIGAAAALFAASALPALAVPPGPPDPVTVVGCPGRSVVTPGTGAQATAPDLDVMASLACKVPAGFVPTVGP